MYVRTITFLKFVMFICILCYNSGTKDTEGLQWSRS